jgi:quercetin dioxygenase-like cupin family protein
MRGKSMTCRKGFLEVISGHAVAAMQDEPEIGLKPGELFHIPPVPHDSWVIGDEPHISLHFLGADSYTK